MHVCMYMHVCVSYLEIIDVDPPLMNRHILIQMGYSRLSTGGTKVLSAVVFGILLVCLLCVGDGLGAVMLAIPVCVCICVCSVCGYECMVCLYGVCGVREDGVGISRCKW